MVKVVYENIENNQFVICFKTVLFHTVWAITNRFIHISPDMNVITEVKMKIDLQNMYTRTLLILIPTRLYFIIDYCCPVLQQNVTVLIMNAHLFMTPPPQLYKDGLVVFIIIIMLELQRARIAMCCLSVYTTHSISM